MKIRDIIWLGARSTADKKLRTVLTILSVMIGVAAIVALVSMVSGVSAGISRSLESIGPSAIYLVPNPTHILTAADVAVIQSFPGVGSVIPMLRMNANIAQGGKLLNVSIIGINNYSVTSAFGGLSFYRGSLYNDTTLPLAVVGYNIATPSSYQNISSIRVNEPMYLTLISGSSSVKSITLIPHGVLNRYGSSIFLSVDDSILVPLQVAESLSNRYSYNVVLVEAKNSSAVGPLFTLLNTVYGDSAKIISVQQIAQTVSSIIGTLGVLLGSIAGISLIVAGISILSIMMVSVNERTREIGILKAIGFKRRDVLVLFLSEALLIGFAGGVLGVIAGIGGSYLLPALISHQFTSSPSSSGGGISSSSRSAATNFSFSPLIQPSLLVLAIIIALVVSIVASLYPAWKASTVNPITALRSE